MDEGEQKKQGEAGHTLMERVVEIAPSGLSQPAGQIPVLLQTEMCLVSGQASC